MDNIPSSAAGWLSTIILFLALLSHREAWTPPTAPPEGSAHIENVVPRVLSMDMSRKFAFVLKCVATAHFLGELLALAPMGFKPDFVSNNCPLAIPTSSSTIHTTLTSIYPTGHLSPSQTFALTLIIFGGFIRLSCHKNLGKMFTWEMSILRDHRLITRGPYQFVRHPSYTGLVFTSVGYLWFLLSRGGYGRECFLAPGPLNPITSWNPKNALGMVYLAMTAFYYVEANVWLWRRTPIEDRALKKQFGIEWDEWAKKVRWRVIPYVF